MIHEEDVIKSGIKTETIEEEQWLNTHCGDNHTVTNVTGVSDNYRSYQCICGSTFKTTDPQPKPYPTAEVTLSCSFCHKPRSEVKVLVASPKASICNECIIVCMEIIVDGFHMWRNKKNEK